MKSVLLRSLLVVLVAIVATSLAVQVAIPLFGETPNPSAFWLSKIIPALVGFPISVFIFRKTDEVAKLHANLSKAYGELATLHAKLSERARLDGMTGTLNRDAFLQQTGTMQAAGSPGTLLLIDADHFKIINDRFGHAAGDAALVAISRAIQSQVRGDDIVGRLGGEEFGVFLAGASDSEANRISERIRIAVQTIGFEPRPGHFHPLSVSIGGANARHDMGVAAVMKLADDLLYKAKSLGRNRVVLSAG